MRFPGDPAQSDTRGGLIWMLLRSEPRERGVPEGAVRELGGLAGEARHVNQEES